MIAHLKGTVLDVIATELILDVQGVGYSVQMGSNHLHRLSPVPGLEVSLCIQTEVKEDEIRLIGMDSFDQRSLFQLFRGVSGVGPKAALNLVDQLSNREITYAIQTDDPAAFTKVSGIGKKTAQRILIDLSGKLDKFANLDLPEPEELPMGKKGIGNIAQDAKSALVNLGYSEIEAGKIIKKKINSDMTLDELIRHCLAELNR